MNYKIIIQREDKNGGVEIWRRYSDLFFENNRAGIAAEILDMYEQIKEKEEEVPY